MNFREESLKVALTGKAFGDPLYFFPRVESTNQLAFQLAGEGAPGGTVVISDHQTRGRGRMQRAWLSPPAANIYLSLILRPSLAPASCTPLTIMAGLAVAEILTRYCPQQVRLKWPNDVLINNKKVCGILTEMNTAGNKVAFVIMGIGVNINMQTQDFSASLAPIATSLRIETGKSFDRVELTVRLLEQIHHFYQLLLSEGIQPLRQLWLSYSQLLDKLVEVTFGDEVYRGSVSGMDDSGALIIKDDHGDLHRVIAGDVKTIEG